MNSGADGLERFVDAQRGTIDAARRELAAGLKRTHWMWFVFPQLRGLGHSAMALRYGLASRDEAAAYAAHPVLGPRLLECTALVLRHTDTSLARLFGAPDDLKFISCMTLFEAAGPDQPVYGEALDVFNGGRRDAATLARLGR